ncbi:MAG: hypothetical protein IJ193_02270 [Bacilli bacterium]|nr:hypothetical protein [Bacilli bacterium]
MKLKYYNSDSFDKNEKKYEVKKKRNTGKILLISASLVTTIFMTGIVGNSISNARKPSIADYIEKNRNNSSYNVNQNSTTNSTSSNTTQSTPKTTTTSSKVKYTDQYDSTSMSMNNYDYMAYQNYLDSFDTDFVYSDLYEIPKALEMEKNYQIPIKDVTPIELKNGKFDANIMLSVIKKNNKEYLADKTTTSFRKASYKEMDDQTVLDICKVIADTLNDQIEKYDFIDVNELRKVVGDLKMFTAPSSSNAFVNDDNVFMISKNMIKLASVMYKENNVEKDTIVHESMHLLQKTVGDKEKKYLQVGQSKKWKDLEVNSLEWKFLYEGDAEKMMSLYTGEPPFTYKNYISYTESITSAIILRDDVHSTTIFEAALDKTPNRLYNLYGVSNEKEKIEFIKLLYTTDVLQSAREDFYQKYDPIYGKHANDAELIDFQLQLKSEICEEVSKKFYETLSTKIHDSNMTKDDIFYTIRVFEADMNNHLEMEKDSKLTRNYPFMVNYVKVQNEFFSHLASSNNMTFDQLVNDFNNYELAINKEQTLKSFDHDTRDYYASKYDQCVNYSNKNIRKMYESVDKSKVK